MQNLQAQIKSDLKRWTFLNYTLQLGRAGIGAQDLVDQKVDSAIH